MPYVEGETLGSDSRSRGRELGLGLRLGDTQDDGPKKQTLTPHGVRMFFGGVVTVPVVLGSGKGLRFVDPDN